MEEMYKIINDKAKNKIFTINETDSIYDKSKFKFQIIRKGKLISMGKWVDYIFVEVELITFGSEDKDRVLGNIFNGTEFKNRQDVTDHAYRTSMAASHKIEMFLKHFTINDKVVVEKLKYNLEVPE
jgi:hypothetical protein